MSRTSDSISPTEMRRTQSVPASGFQKLQILGVPISLIDMRVAVATILGWVEGGTPKYVCIRDVHGVMRSQDEPDLRAIHEQAGLVTPDGMPLVWLAKRKAGNVVGRVCGSDLVDALCATSAQHGIRHYFYGAKEGVASEMVRRLIIRYPGLQVVGTMSPPFGDLTSEEDEAITQRIAAASPDIVWVGLSTPKQEYWMQRHVGRIPGATLIGIGAAFDFHAGKIARAPIWMQRAGLEWFHRLCSEPKRLWKRYLVLAPLFIFKVIGEEIIRSSNPE